MTRTEAGAVTLLGQVLLCLALALLPGGCGGQTEVYPDPGSASEAARVLRTSPTGPIVLVFTQYPFRPGTPPDGVTRAVAQALDRTSCSAAAFYWNQKTAAERWLNQQIAVRRNHGQPVRLIMAGHGLAATEASEMAREILVRDQTADVQIVLLLTLDAVRAGRINYAAGAAGAAVNRIPGVNMNLIAYDGAPAPDGVRLRSHINYYQSRNSVYHGTPMPGAENHLLSDWSGYLNHGNIDDFAFPLLTNDIKAALVGGMR